ncbi:hypothetical protein ILUMI_13374 [Ignelater luminosus]|uniref:Ionotropic glutamate receptor C-terminal domain-containing protein n=1 Tax=Ignelater luminosus TaxID=2038154 RepID=A0A8K0CWU7_IGNLU|nr:hypothetical protein ILUMI_13374 [Ignelater luminosus]
MAELIIRPTNTSQIKGCLVCFIQKLFLPEVTLQFIYEDLNEDYFSLMMVNNPHFIINISKPVDKPLHYYNYVIYVGDCAWLNDTLIKLKDSSIWNNSKSPRGKFVVICSFCHVEVLSDMFLNTDITSVTLLTKQLTENDSLILNEKVITVFKKNLEQCQYVAFYIIIKTPQIKSITMITPFKIDISGSQEAYVKALYSVMLKNLKIIGKTLNANVSYAFVEYPKEILYNHSNDNVWLYLALYRDSYLYKDYDVSDYFFFDTKTWALPKVAKRSSITSIISVFEEEAWITVFVTFSATVLTCWSFAQLLNEHVTFKRFQGCFLVIARIMLTNPSNVLPKKTSLRIVLLIYMLICINITNLFQGNLISVLTQPKTDPEIRTIEELAESSFLLLATNKVKNMTLERSDNPVYMKIYKKIIVKGAFNMTRDITLAANSKNYGVAIGKKILRHVFPQFMPKLYLLEYNSGLQEIELSLAIRKGHYFLNTLNSFRRGFTEGGLYKKIFSDVALENSKNIELKDEAKIVSLAIQHLRGLFLCWLTGLSIATVVFITELCFYHSLE